MRFRWAVLPDCGGQPVLLLLTQLAGILTGIGSHVYGCVQRQMQPWYTLQSCRVHTHSAQGAFASFEGRCLLDHSQGARSSAGCLCMTHHLKHEGPHVQCCTAGLLS